MRLPSDRWAKTTLLNVAALPSAAGNRKNERESFQALLHSSYVRKALITFLLIVLMLPNTVNAAARPAAVASAGRTDSQIESDFRMRLGRSKLASDGIQIRVKAGVATLTGKTSVVQHKGSATRMAKSAGAHQVANQIEDLRSRARGRRRKDGCEFAPCRKRFFRSSCPGSPKPEGSVAPATVSAVTTSSPAPPPVRRAQIKH